jgi:hypothetical protein
VSPVLLVDVYEKYAVALIAKIRIEDIIEV